MTIVDDLDIVILPSFAHDLGMLVALEEKTDLPVYIRRVFIVSGTVGAIRGKHAHKELTQALICVHGKCIVVCDDGEKTRKFKLERGNQAIIIPPGIWAEQQYLEEGTVLAVLCDLAYDENDYIREYDKFLTYRKEVVL